MVVGVGVQMDKSDSVQEAEREIWRPTGGDREKLRGSGKRRRLTSADATLSSLVTMVTGAYDVFMGCFFFSLRAKKKAIKLWDQFLLNTE